LFPDATLILCADDDLATDGNPGLTKATAGNGRRRRLAVPLFGTHRPEKATDFNDTARLCGAEAVALAIAAANAIHSPPVR
jgi:putative DNA primase/helicase